MHLHTFRYHNARKSKGRYKQTKPKRKLQIYKKCYIDLQKYQDQQILNLDLKIYIMHHVIHYCSTLGIADLRRKRGQTGRVKKFLNTHVSCF